LKWDPLTPVGALPPVDRAIVAIARAIREIATNPEGHVLVLDEPTAYLPSESVDKLFDAVKKVTRQGTGVVFISHRTDEILNLTDRISVLRDGRKVATVNTKETKEADLVAMILGPVTKCVLPRSCANSFKRSCASDQEHGRWHNSKTQHHTSPW
jgi:ribose transport system ATP-binding protein